MKLNKNNIQDNKEIDTSSISSTLNLFIEWVLDKTMQIMDHYFSKDHTKLIVKNILSKRFRDEINISELNIKDDLTLDDLLLVIANNTVTSTRDEKQDWFTPYLKKVSYNDVKGKWVSEANFSNAISKYKKTITDQKMVEYLSKWIIPTDVQLLDDSIYNHEKKEFREDFLWHVMEHYWNYHLSRLIFDHFLDEHKQKFKVYNKIFYTTEIHRFLFEIVKNEDITLKEAFTEILWWVEDVHELSALHILVHELKDNNYDSSCIINVIKDSLSIIKSLRESCPRSKYLTKIDKLNVFAKTKYIWWDNFRVILEHLQLDGKEINVENIIEYGEMNRVHLYKWAPIARMYEKIFNKDEDSTSINKEDRGPNTVENNVPTETIFWKLISSTWTSSSIWLSKTVLTMWPAVSDILNWINFTIRSHSFFRNKKKSKEEDSPLTREASLLRLQFVQQLQWEIERNVQSYKDELNWVPLWKVQKIFMKFASQRWLEEAIKLFSYTSKWSKLYYILFVKIYAKFLIAAWFIATRLFIKSDIFRDWKAVTWVKKWIRFKISYVLKNYIIENADVLLRISQLESEMFYLETILNKSEDFTLENSKNLGKLERLWNIREELKEINPEQYYEKMEEFVKDSIRLQSKTFSETIDEHNLEE